MPLFAYKGRDKRGDALTGMIEAENANAVADQLFSKGITPINIEVSKDNQQHPVAAGTPLNLGGGKIKLAELVVLCQQFHTLMRAGVPLLKGLSSLVQTAENQKLKQVLQEVMQDLQAGVDFGTALGKHPKVFTPLFVSLIRVGESTGKLDEIFQQLAVYLELERNTRQQISQALRYPMTVISAIAIAMVVINIYVLPQFASAFARFGADLPLFTRLLMDMSAFFVNNWPFLLAVVGGSVFLFLAWVKTEEGDVAWSNFKLRIPVIGDIILKATLGRFCRSFAMAIRSGVPITQSLTTISTVVDNAWVGKRVLRMRDDIERGESLSNTAAATGLFTPLVLQMIAIGEETGAVDELLLETAEHYEREVSYKLSRLSDMIEPVLIVTIAGMVLILALGIFLPMWDLSTAIRR